MLVDLDKLGLVLALRLMICNVFVFMSVGAFLRT